MASIYKRTQDKSRKGACWYIGYVDHQGRRKTRRGFTDRGATERLAGEIAEEVRLVRAGLKAPRLELARLDLPACLSEFRKHLENRDNTDCYVASVLDRVTTVMAGCEIKLVNEISATDVSAFLAKLRRDGNVGKTKQRRPVGKTTSNHYLRSVKHFCRWLVRTRRLAENPVLELEMLNAQTDPRHQRRALSIDELERLLNAAQDGPEIENLTGLDRAMLYLLAAWTGYRKGEIGSLTSTSFDFESEPATVTVAASYSKRRRRDQQVLHPYVAAKLRDWLAGKATEPDSVLFPISRRSGSSERDTAKMMALDLERARANWLAELPEQERVKHAKSDYLCYKDKEGRFADFHANRHTFITNLARAGIAPKTAQELARHSDIRLTLGLYTHTNMDERAAAVRRLPSPRTNVAAVSRAGSDSLERTPSDGESTEGGGAQHSGSAPQTQAGETGQSDTAGDPQTNSIEVSGTALQVLEETTLGITSRHSARSDKNEAVGARTQDLRIKRHSNLAA